MNKVVSIQVAGQVFWIDEHAFSTLRDYLQTLRAQLGEQDGADEIYADMELRVAELLFAEQSRKDQVVSSARLQQVIEQIGYVQEVDLETRKPRSSQLDPDNRILGGVCGGLSPRIGLPAFVLRLLFLGLSAVFGLGVVLYLVFWISFERKSVSLSASPTRPPLSLTLQRVLFLPITLIGALFEAVLQHVLGAKRFYRALLTHLFSLALIGVGMLFCAVLLEFLQSRLFAWPIALLLGAAAAYLVIIGAVVYVQTFYLGRPRQLLGRGWKLASIAPALLLLAAGFQINLAHSEAHRQTIHKTFPLHDATLSLAFSDEHAGSSSADRVEIEIQPSSEKTDEVGLSIEYSAYGATLEQAQANIEAIQYSFDYDQGSLRLGTYQTLDSGQLRRGQAVKVVVVLPADTAVNSSRQLHVQAAGSTYRYLPGQSNAGAQHYRVHDGFLHEQPRDGRLSDNERRVLEQLFCEEFFVSESWRCDDHIQASASANSRLDPALREAVESVDALRQHLEPNRNISTADLQAMDSLAERIAGQVRGQGRLHQHLQHLIRVNAGGDSS